MQTDALYKLYSVLVCLYTPFKCNRRSRTLEDKITRGAFVLHVSHRSSGCSVKISITPSLNVFDLFNSAFSFVVMSRSERNN